jgi:hypothetical protein
MLNVIMPSVIMPSVIMLNVVAPLQVFYFPQDGCDDYIEQLIPTTQPIPKIKMKVFGNSGSGKTTLIESMRAGYFSGLFRRSKRNSGSKKGTVTSGLRFFTSIYFRFPVFYIPISRV